MALLAVDIVLAPNIEEHDEVASAFRQPILAGDELSVARPGKLVEVKPFAFHP